MLGGNKFRLRQGFALQNAWDAGLPAGLGLRCAVRTSHVRFSLFPKELWMRLTNALVSGTIGARKGGFAVAPYLCRDYYIIMEKIPRITLLHLTYAGIITCRLGCHFFCRTLHLTYPGITHLPSGGQPKRQKEKRNSMGVSLLSYVGEVTSRRSGRGSRPPCVPAGSRGGAGSAAGRRPGRRCRPEGWEPDSSRLG